MSLRLHHCFGFCLLASGIVIAYLYKFTSFSLSHSLVETGVVKTTTREFTSKVTFEAENNTNITARFIKRRLLIERKCASSNLTLKDVHMVSGHAPSNLTLCVVPKAACTIWLRLFTFLVNKGTSNRSITDYSKFIVHFTPGKPFVTYNISGKDKELVGTSIRAMTTRDPFTRLWSAYIDKFLLIDFWFNKGKQIIYMVRPNATSEAKRCGNNVTFPEFIQYVIRIGHNITGMGTDSHWLPVTDICNPCVFKPDFIVKQETFLPEFTHVVNRVGLMQAVTPVLQNNQDNYEIQTEIDYNFSRYPDFSACVTKLELAKRIWTAMKLNGYLHPRDKFPIHIEEEKLNASTVKQMVFTARRRSGANRNLKKAWRRKSLTDAYRKLSKEQIIALRKLYQTDFDFFGYEGSPPV